MKFYHHVLFILVILAGRGDAEIGTPAETRSVTASVPTRPKPQGSALIPTTNTTITAKTAEEFLKAIGPDREVRLVGREYVLSDLDDRHMDFVRWDPATIGKTLTIRNVRNFKLVGANKEASRLIVRPYSVFVLNFEGCTNIVLENLVMGHEPEKGVCEAGVVGATNCEMLTFARCDLFGCGTEGLTLNKVSGLFFRDSTIRECSYGILTAESCENLNFENSRFVRNEEYWGLRFHDTRDVLFADCIIQENKSADPLFQVMSSSNIRVRGGTISKNKVNRLSSNEKLPIFENVEGIQDGPANGSQPIRSETKSRSPAAGSRR